jgi:hypothetical protein
MRSGLANCFATQSPPQIAGTALLSQCSPDMPAPLGWPVRHETRGRFGLQGLLVCTLWSACLTT